jgi:DNA polymerase III epsilon subunit-like protein
MNLEHFISVDIEAAGPIPGEYSMLSLGACSVDNTGQSFLLEFQPINLNSDPNALKVAGISLEELQLRGVPPAIAMEQFRAWIEETVGSQGTPVFVGFNAPFDWSFVNYYFHRFLGSNPFGFAGLDIKAFYMGKYGTQWRDTKSSKIAAALHIPEQGDHNALHDAVYQARLFQAMLSE